MSCCSVLTSQPHPYFNDACGRQLNKLLSKISILFIHLLRAAKQSGHKCFYTIDNGLGHKTPFGWRQLPTNCLRPSLNVTSEPLSLGNTNLYTAMLAQITRKAGLPPNSIYVGEKVCHKKSS